MKTFSLLLVPLLLQVVACSSDLAGQGMMIPPRKEGAETGSAFMARIATLSLQEREEEIYRAAISGNIPAFLRELVSIEASLPDGKGVMRHTEYVVMPDYLAIGSDEDFCRIPANPCTAQRIADAFGASLPTSLVADQVYEKADFKLTPFSYYPSGNSNELVEKFVEHNMQIERQFAEAGGVRGRLTSGIKKDIILSVRIAEKPDRVVIYGWHKPDGTPIQPVYSGHIYWYVDYSHGIRLMGAMIKIDGKEYRTDDVLSDPVLFRVLSNEAGQMGQARYSCDAGQRR